MLQWQRTKNGNLRAQTPTYRAIICTNQAAGGGHWWMVADAATGGKPLADGTADSLESCKQAAGAAITRLDEEKARQPMLGL